MKTIQESIIRLEQSGYSFARKGLQLNIPDAKRMMCDVMRQLLDRPVWAPAYDAIADWLTDNHGLGLVLAGPTGTGKTLMATRVIPVILHQSMDKIPACVAARDINACERELRNCHLIIIDDLGTEDELNNFGNRRLVATDIIDRAERRGDILIITTNLSARELIAKYGNRTTDRLQAICAIVTINGKSKRQTN